MLRSNNSRRWTRFTLEQNKPNWTVLDGIYHSNISLPQKLHDVNNPDRRQQSVSGDKLFLNQSVWIYPFLSTCLPSLTHCEEEPFSSLEVSCCELAGQSCRLGFSNFKALNSLMSGRYTVPSWAIHRKTTMDRGQPFSRDRTTPAWKWDLNVLDGSRIPQVERIWVFAPQIQLLHIKLPCKELKMCYLNV